MKLGAPGTHGFDGSECPSDSKEIIFSSFSVGIFEWIPKTSGYGVKRGKVKVRIKGSTKEPEKVYRKAREICAQLDSGIYPGKKNVSVL